MIEHSSAGLMQSPVGRKAHRIHFDRALSSVGSPRAIVGGQ